MTSNELSTIGVSLGNIAAAIAERLRHEGSGAVPPFTFVDECFDKEARRVRAVGQVAFADALEALRADVGGL